MSTSQPLVSFIIPIYSVTKYLDDTLQSIAKQDYPNTEIIVVDDGSPMEATKRIRTICSAYKGVTILNQPNAGQAAAREAGLTRAKGDYIWFIDADDRLVAGTVPHLVEMLEAQPKAVAAYGSKNLIRDSGLPFDDLARPELDTPPSGDILPELLSGVNLMTPGTVCMRASTARAIDYPKGMRQGEDWVMFCRMAIQGDVLYASERIVLEYRIHEDNVSHAVFKSPESLFSMLDAVYRDPAFEKRIGKEKLAEYFAIHHGEIRRHLREGYERAGDMKTAARYRKHRFPKWHALKQTLFQPEALARTEKSAPLRVLHIGRYVDLHSNMPAFFNVLEHHDPKQSEHIFLDIAIQTQRMKMTLKRWGVTYHSMRHTSEDFDKWQTWQLRRYIQHCDADVIHVWENLLPPTVCSAIKAAGCPVIHTPFVRLEKDAPVPKRWQTIYRNDIPAPVDSSYYHPRPAGRLAIIDELYMRKETEACFVGMTLPFNKKARHAYFLRAAKDFLHRHPHAHFILCGTSVTADNVYFVRLAEFLGIEHRTHFMGERWDMADIYSTLDIHTHCPTEPMGTLSAWQALACGTPCVTNDPAIHEAQDGAWPLLPDSDDPDVLVSAWEAVLNSSERTKEKAMQSSQAVISTKFTTRAAASALEDLYASYSKKRR
jgi:glycosyltransferase involved in cell wall biosynthesis